MSTAGPTTSREASLQEIRDHDRFLLVTHERPDGDALGSLVAMHEILTALGKDSLMFAAREDLPLPYEYRFFVFDGLISQAPPDLDQRTVIFLDCGNIDRNPLDAVKRDDLRILNIDHHHDNTHFGTVDHVVVDASCTAEIVWDLMHELKVTPTPTIAHALYVGLVTDTGRFMYENTGVSAHVMAAELIAAGVDVNAVYRRLYEEMPFSKLALIALGLAKVRRYDAGRVTLTLLRREDFQQTGAADSYAEGLIDHLRSVRGTKVAVVAREVAAEGDDDEPVLRKVSLRATNAEVDVSVIARAGGGGGHRQAAGFTTSLSEDELIVFLRKQITLQLGLSAV